MFERYTEKARRVIFFARYEASQFGSPYIETEHLLLGLLREDKALANRFLRSHASAQSIREQIESHTTIREKVSTSIDLPLSNESKRALAYGAEEAERLSDKHIGTEHLLLGLLREEKCFAAQVLVERGLRLSQVREELAHQPHASAQQKRQPEVLGEFSLYVTDLIGQTQPLVGRENELDRLIELLCRFTQKNPVLVGENGVGKKTIVGGLARRIADGDVPQVLAEKPVVMLDLPPLRMLERDWPWQERLDRALVTSAETGSIFFVNRMHDLPGEISPAASTNVTDLLRRPIMAGKIQCVGTSTPAAFARLREYGHWLAQCFEPIQVAPAAEEEVIRVLHGIKEEYERFHNVSYEDDAIARAVICAGKYIKRGCLPGTAVDLLDEAGAAAQLQQSSLPMEVIGAQKRIRFIAQRMESSIANHEFEKARFYSAEERKERAGLRELREKYGLNDSPALKVGKRDIERALSKLLEAPIGESESPPEAGSDESGSTSS